MARGFFLVSPADDRKGVTFRIDPGAQGDPPEDQATLMNDVERALRVLRAVFEGRSDYFERYFGPLLSLAQGGLVGERAQPGIAQRALAELKREILEREAGRVKNQYMARLGKAAAWFGVPALLLGLAARSAPTFPMMSSPHGVVSAAVFSNLCFLMAGCAAGVWISFGARKASLTFEELSVPEQDFLNPIMRVAFAELMTLSLALLFHVGAVEVKFGSLSTSSVFSQPVAALLVGLLAGFSEQVLSKKLATQAGRLFEANNA